MRWQGIFSVMIGVGALARTVSAEEDDEAGRSDDQVTASGPKDGVVTLGPTSDGAQAVLSGPLLQSMWQTFAADATVERGFVTNPTAMVLVSLLDPSTPLAVIGGARYRALGLEDSGPAIESWIIVSRSFGDLTFATRTMVGRGTEGREDVDLQLGATAVVELPRWFVGADANGRTEVVDEYKTEEDEGRPFEVTAGAVTSLELGDLALRAQAGWRSPRGYEAPGPIALMSASYEL